MVVVVGMVVVVVVVVLVVVVVDVVVVGAWVVVVVAGQLPNVTVMVGAQFVFPLEIRVNGPVGQLREILVVYSQQPLIRQQPVVTWIVPYGRNAAADEIDDGTEDARIAITAISGVGAARRWC